MPNDCWNHITITCDCIIELDNLVNNELKHKEGDKLVYNKTVTMIKKGSKGIIFDKITNWQPDIMWLEDLLHKYSMCWIKNEWYEEGGLAGVWVGSKKEDKLNIKELEWEDLTIEGKMFLFDDSDNK
jgi:hypothetical protein